MPFSPYEMRAKTPYKTRKEETQMNKATESIGVKTRVRSGTGSHATGGGSGAGYRPVAVKTRVTGGSVQWSGSGGSGDIHVGS